MSVTNQRMVQLANSWKWSSLIGLNQPTRRVGTQGRLIDILSIARKFKPKINTTRYESCVGVFMILILKSSPSPVCLFSGLDFYTVLKCEIPDIINYVELFEIVVLLLVKNNMGTSVLACFCKAPFFLF